jgi:hypothetical protein
MDPEGQVRPYSQIKMCMCVILNMSWVDMYIVVMMVDVSRNKGVEEKIVNIYFYFYSLKEIYTYLKLWRTC